MGSYLRPTGLEAALAALAAAPRAILAGGTDFYPARVGRPVEDDVLDITALPDLRRIEETGSGWRIPALATWTDLIEAKLPPLLLAPDAAGPLAALDEPATAAAMAEAMLGWRLAHENRLFSDLQATPAGPKTWRVLR